MQINWSRSGKRANAGALPQPSHSPRHENHTAAQSLAPLHSRVRAAGLASHTLNTSDPGHILNVPTPAFSVSNNWSAVRREFLAKHGPNARLPHGPAISKELRKTLLAIEMAAWEHP